MKARDEQQEATVRGLQEKIAQLEALLEKVRREGKRQAAPFRKGEGPKPDPKKPGRKSGDQHGRHAHRQSPPPGAIDEEYDVPLPDRCPHCGSPELEEGDIAVQYQTEIPRRPIHRRFNIHRGKCRHCGRKVQGRHPLQTSDAVGAAASQLGPEAHAAIAALNKDLGLSHGKVARCFEQLFGIPIARGTSARSVLRTAKRVHVRAQSAIGEALGQAFAPMVLVPDYAGSKVKHADFNQGSRDHMR